MEKSYTVIASIMKNLRSRQGLTQEAMAEILETSHRNYQKIEAGQAAPNYKSLKLAVHKLGVNPAMLLANDPSSTEPNLDIKSKITAMLNNCDEKQMQLLSDLLLVIMRNSEIDL